MKKYKMIFNNLKEAHNAYCHKQQQYCGTCPLDYHIVGVSCIELVKKHHAKAAKIMGLEIEEVNDEEI